jgi:nucleotide-binding universal stress UspA family protein
MRRVLVPVDGSTVSDRAVSEAIKLARGGEVEIHLINVQPRIFPEETMIYMPADKIDTYYYQQSEKALASAQKLLRDAAVGFTAHRATGPIAETIVAKAKDLDCAAIAMGTHGHGKLAGMLLGSVANKVLHLSDVPVTLVRGEPLVDFTGRLSAS